MENPVDTLLHTHGSLSTRQLIRNLGCSKRKLKFFIATSMHCAKAEPMKSGSTKKGIRVYTHSVEPVKYAVRFVKAKKETSIIVKPTVEVEVKEEPESESSDSDPEDYEIV
jgi:hypothetical protein